MARKSQDMAIDPNWQPDEKSINQGIRQDACCHPGGVAFVRMCVHRKCVHNHGLYRKVVKIDRYI